MSTRSLKLSYEGITIARNALKQKGWTQEVLADFLACSNQPISKFFNGKAVNRNIFKQICEALNLKVQEVVDNSQDSKTEPNETKLNSSIDVNALVQEVREKIRDSIIRQCGTIRVLDMSQPIGLDDIYTNVNILEKITGRRRKKIDELIKEYKDCERFGLGRITEERVPGLKAVNKYCKIIILGKPGAGKTTFLKYVAIQCIAGEWKNDIVPIFVTLKDFAEADNQSEIIGYIAQKFQTSGVNKTQITDLLSHGKALILLDGLDEVKEVDTSRIIKEICYLSDNFPGNHFVLTCRIAAKEYTFEQFTEVEVADFDDEQIKTFVTKWFQGKDSDFKEQFLEQLETYQHLKELTTNPLLLTLLCLEFETSAEFPSDRAELYKRATNTLLRKWDTKRRIERDIAYKQLSVQRKEDLLSEIALKTFKEGNYFFKQGHLEQYIANYIQNLPDAQTDPQALQLDSEAVLKSIEAQHGLLVERAVGIYSFSHLTFQEYFTAKAIVSNCNPQAFDDPTLHGLVRYIFDKRWREVFLLVAQVLPKADILLLSMKYTIDVLAAQHRHIQELLTWASQKANEVSSPYKQATVRSFYICLASGISVMDNFYPHFFEDVYLQEMSELLRVLDASIGFSFYWGSGTGFSMGNFSESLSSSLSLDFNLNHARAHASLLGRTAKVNDVDSLDEIDEYDENEPFDDTNFYTIADALYDVLNSDIDEYLEEFLELLYDKLPQSVHNKSDNYPEWRRKKSLSWAEELRALINKHRNIDFNWQFSNEQWSVLRAYCYANKLLIECLNSHCYVTRETRTYLEDYLLLPFAQIEREVL